MDTPASRIKWTLERRCISAAQLGRQLGISRSAVSQWWSKQNPTSPHRKLYQIAACLDVSVEWLMTGRDDSSPSNSWIDGPSDLAASSVLQLIKAPLVGVAEGEAWREGPFSEFGEMRHFAFEMRGASANRTIQSGEYVICAGYRHMRPDGPRQADLVVAKKWREKRECKIFIARLRHERGRWELHYESDEPRWRQERPIHLSRDLGRDNADNSPIEIIGYILGAVRANPQPQLSKSRCTIDVAAYPEPNLLTAAELKT